MGGSFGIGEVGERLRRSTVHIRSGSGRRASAGSGVVSDSSGTIVTNAHVVAAGEHQVELWDGRVVAAEVESRDEQRDLARLKVRAGELQAVSFRKTPPASGELVVAVGNPLGFTGALTSGVVQTTGPLLGMGRREWVQAAVRLAPGNSGGPLGDTAGLVVGINTMVVRGGIALAIPAGVVEDFLRRGARPRIGVTIQQVNIYRRLGLLILSVETASAAERASLLMGDVLVGTSERRFGSAEDLSEAIEAAAEKGHLKLRFVRGDPSREREVVVALAAWPAREAA